jgi:ABC-type multidrug transport system ATPase subunit
MGLHYLDKFITCHISVSDMSSLHVDSVIKSFGNKQILTDIFISCKPGEILGLLGRNGSGKSTLLKVIFGSITADSKFVKIDNRIVDGLFDLGNLIKYLPQDNFLPNHVKINNIISLFCDKENAEILRNCIHIKPLLDKRSKQLSGGERRLVEIFLIVFSNAKYVLIDEPFNGVAPVYIDDIKNAISEQSNLKGFIITDHDYRNIVDIATQIILIHDGGTKLIKNKDELKYWGYIPDIA